MRHHPRSIKRRIASIAAVTDLSGWPFNVMNYDQLALEYARHRRVHPEVLKGLLSTSEVGAHCRVLEVGCGTGNYIVALEERAGSSCWGVDPSDEMLSQAREATPEISFQVGQAESLDFSSDFFDLIFSVDVIHHLEDHLAYFSEAHRVLKPGGRVCTVTDSAWIIRRRVPLATYFPETVEVDLERYPRIPDLRKALEQVGFKDSSEITVELPYQLTDAQACSDKAFSSLHLIPQEAFQREFDHMEKDLRLGPISCVARYVLLWATK